MRNRRLFSLALTVKTIGSLENMMQAYKTIFSGSEEDSKDM